MRKILLTMVIFYSGTLCADVYDLPKVRTVQNKNFLTSDEVGAIFNYFPVDPFNKYLAIGASYTHFFSEFTGWEIINAEYFLPANAKLKDQVINSVCPGNPSCDPAFVTSLGDTAQYMAMSNIVFTPIYAKNLLFNSKIVHTDISFLGGGGATMFALSGIQPCIDLGVGLRFFITQSMSLKAEARYFAYLSSSVGSNMSVGINYSFSFGKANKTGVAEFDE